MKSSKLMLFQTPISLDDLKDAVKFIIHHSCYSGIRNPNDKNRWLLRNEHFTFADIEHGEDVVLFINHDGKMQRPENYVSIEYSNKLKGFKTKKNS